MTTDLAAYALRDTADILTPALLIYPDVVDANIQTTIRILGDAGRWRPHVKTAKLAYTMRRMVELGVKQSKCATTAELSTACEAGMSDVLLAYSMVGANARRVREIAARFPNVRLSVLVETAEQAAAWTGSPLGIFVDVNPGMNRTGVSQDRADEVDRIVRSARAAGIAVRGLHYYDGHVRDADMDARRKTAFAGYDKLMEIVAVVEKGGPVEEVITSGTPSFPCGAEYPGFLGAKFIHRVSPGTVVYNDTSSLVQLPGLGYQPAVAILSSVVSHPKPNVATCDGGHKSVSADEGVPTCAVLGRPDATPMKPSEEHLPIEFASGVPAIGELLYLIPRHVCPSVNNFDYALLVREGKIVAVEPVTARGHETRLAATA
ncbi:MAG: D-TA family PLP-dependent enzyme [Bryobacteraceae bacterium]